MAKGIGNPGGVFIPAGVLLGMGLGFAFGNLVAGMYIGLGAGFLLFALSMFIFPGKDKDKE